MGNTLYVCGGRDINGNLISLMERLVDADSRVGGEGSKGVGWQPMAITVGFFLFPLMVPQGNKEILIIGCNGFL